MYKGFLMYTVSQKTWCRICAITSSSGCNVIKLSSFTL